MKTLNLEISKIHCQSCVKLINMSLEDLEWLTVSVDTKEKKVNIQYDEGKLNPQQIINAIKEWTEYEVNLLQ